MISSAIAQFIDLLQREPLLYGAVLLLLAGLTLFSLYQIFRSYHYYRMMSDTPTAKIATAAQGYAELEGRGKLLDGEPITSPLTNEKCLWYRYRVEERNRSGKNEWRVIERGVSEHLFAVDDESGESVVDPDGAEVIPNQRRRWQDDSRYGGGRGEASLLSLLIGKSQYRFTQELILPHSDLYLIGRFQTLGNAAEMVDDREALRTLLASWKADQATLLRRFDKDNSGHIDATEWEAARQAARQELLQQRLQRAGGAVTHLISRAETLNRPFI
ncbi:MAG: hypothetical protein HQL49_10150, partial [Gammaproteobacteria bacterium]|nr:hypothetical protein [Gammaproteobacteria bacterium]